MSIGLAVLCGIGVLALAGCGSSSKSSSSAAAGGGGSGGGSPASLTLKIGVPEALTGDEAFAGVEETNAMKLAAKEINAGQDPKAAGVKVELTTADYQSLPSKAAQVTSQMLSDSSYSAFAGITSGGDGEAIKPLIKNDMRPFMMIQATGSPLTCGQSNLWDMAPNGDPGQAMFGPFLKSHGIKALGIMYDQQSVPQVSNNNAMKGLMKKAGINIVADVATTTSQTNFSSAISQVLQSNPDAVYADATSAAALMTRQLRLAGYKGLILAQGSAAGSTFTKPAGKAAAGVTFVTFWVSSLLPTAIAKKYVPAYTAAYHTAPDYFATNGYDAIRFLAEAAAKAKSTDPEALQKAMVGFGKFTGALGSYTFGADDRVPRLPFHLFQWNKTLTAAPVVASMPAVSGCSS